MDLLLVLPILIPLTTAVIALALWTRPQIQRIASVIGASALLFAGILLFAQIWHHGISATQLGSWPAPFGITLVADVTSAVMVVIVGVMGLTISIYSLGSIDPDRERYGFHALVHLLLTGVSGAFLTGDLFNLYVWFEVMLISSFVLIALGGTAAQLEGALKYVTMSLLASMLFLGATGIIYGVAGSLNLADLAIHFDGAALPGGLLLALAMLFLVAFGIKSAIFPLFFWLPASYHTGPVVISALFAGLLTKVGVYALVRIFTLIFAGTMETVSIVLLVIAGFTMTVGVLGAVAQNGMRRLLSFHIVSQIGYMVMGLALLTPLAMAGVLFFLVHNILAKTNLFLISGVIERLRGTEQLLKLGGFYRGYPALAGLFLISALSLAGLPPFSGFWAKLMLIRAGLEVEQYLIVAIALGVSLLTLFSMTKIWAEAFWKETPATPVFEAPMTGSTRLALMIPIALLALLSMGMGLIVEPLIEVSQVAAEQLLDSTQYVEAVLGPDALVIGD
ncbi:MAG: Na+/H+ antiporter subunit D [Caldilineaceae bacterium]|nr:Na+/H+ antiporter subunit D [Caldilineaceae bacterium]